MAFWYSFFDFTGNALDIGLKLFAVLFFGVGGACAFVGLLAVKVIELAEWVTGKSFIDWGDAKYRERQKRLAEAKNDQ